MRLFVAVCFTKPVKDMLCDVIAELKKTANGNFTRPENLHLTMAFIGETNEFEKAKTAIKKAANRRPFDITVGGIGNFNDLFFVRSCESGALKSLAADIRRELATQGFDVDTKPFKAHITVARRVCAMSMPQIKTGTEQMTAARLSLMCSQRIEGRLLYSDMTY